MIINLNVKGCIVLDITNNHLNLSAVSETLLVQPQSDLLATEQLHWNSNR